MNNSNVSFYSGFSYLRPVAKGSVNSKVDGFGSYMDSVVAIPGFVDNRPPYIQYYLEYPSNTFRIIGGPGDLLCGNDSSNMFFDGYANDVPYDAPFKVTYIIYDRKYL